MSKCEECNSGDCERCCIMQALEELLKEDPHYRECDCGCETCFVCNFYRSKGAVVYFAPERTRGSFTSKIEKWKFYELYDYAVNLEKELALPRSDEVDMFGEGNVLRGTREDDQGLHVMVCDDFTDGDNEFLGTVLVDYRYRPGVVKTFRADTSWWKMSSLQEAANEKA